MVSLLARTRDLLVPAVSRPSLGLDKPLIQRVPRAFPQEVKWSGYEADHLFPSSAKVKNTWNCTSMPVYAVTPPCLIKYKSNLLVRLFNMVFASHFIWIVLQNIL